MITKTPTTSHFGLPPTNCPLEGAHNIPTVAHNSRQRQRVLQQLQESMVN